MKAVRPPYLFQKPSECKSEHECGPGGRGAAQTRPEDRPALVVWSTDVELRREQGCNDDPFAVGSDKEALFRQHAAE